MTHASAAAKNPLLRRWDEVFNRWYAQQLHHTAIGLPFQPQPEGPVAFGSDEAATFAAFRILFTAYWMYGQQIFLLYEHFGGDMTEYEGLFLDGLRQQAEVVGFAGDFHPYTRECWGPDSVSVLDGLRSCVVVGTALLPTPSSR